MKRTTMPALTVIGALTLAACSQTPLPAAPLGQLAYGLSGGGTLAAFGLDNAQASLTTRAITGLPAGEALMDLDVRNTDNRLYGISATGRVYRLDPATGVATADGSAASQSVIAMDFNPVANRLRVLGSSDLDLNFRLTLNAAPVPATSPAGTLTADGTFTYAAGGTNPELVAAAYTNSFDNSAAGAVNIGTTTTLYSLDAGTDQLVVHSAGPQFSTLTAVGALGVDIMAGRTGFDMVGASGAYLSSSTSAGTNVYALNLTTGQATLKTSLSGVALTGLALQPAAQ